VETKLIDNNKGQPEDCKKFDTCPKMKEAILIGAPESQILAIQICSMCEEREKGENNIEV